MRFFLLQVRALFHNWQIFLANNFKNKYTEKRTQERCGYMDFSVGQVIKMKKAHPCGENRWEILRVGMDFRLRCEGCGRQIMIPRKTVEKGFKGFL